MNATKVLAVSLAIAAAVTLGVAIKLDEPPRAAAVLTAGGLDAQRGGRILLDVSRRTFRFPWPLVEDEATITCRPRGVATVITSSGEYGLSGRALAAGYPSIWDALLPIELRRDAALAPLVKTALALCPETEGAEHSRDLRQKR